MFKKWAFGCRGCRGLEYKLVDDVGATADTFAIEFHDNIHLTPGYQFLKQRKNHGEVLRKIVSLCQAI